MGRLTNIGAVSTELRGPERSNRLREGARTSEMLKHQGKGTFHAGRMEIANNGEVEITSIRDSGEAAF